MKKIILLYCFCLSGSMSAQIFETGVVLDSLPVANHQEETFALYLPTTYNLEELSPVLFIFSPSGKGKRAINVFKNAAEAHNYILVCSNNSRNGPYSRNLAIAERLFNHIFANFKIAENRMYLAGFSGGARMATAIAVLSGVFEGVIACGAGFASVPNYVPSNQDFYYVGICGNRDMNFQEMLDIKTYLSQLKFRNALVTFDGNHRWPPKEQISIAFKLFEMEAHKKRTLQLSAKQLKENYLKSYESLKTALSQSRPLLAKEKYEQILGSYGPYYDLDSIAKGLENLKKSNGYKNTLIQRKKAFAKEDVLNERFIARFTKEFEAPEKANLKWWDKELEKLDKIASKANVETSNMLERVQYKLFAAAYETRHSVSETTTAQHTYRNSILSKMRNQLFER